MIDLTEPVFCRNCGCTLEPDEVDSEINGRPSGICSGCRQVTNDYYWIDDYDEFSDEEYEEWLHSGNCTCELCLQNYPERYYLVGDDDDDLETAVSEEG